VQPKQKKTVFVGVSGGVDSSVSLALLKEQGFNVVGCFIKTWQPDFITCTWRDERRDAMRVCAFLDVPFITIDAEKEYKELVGEYFINEYRAGRTPNPDVMCNREIKFGVFLKYALDHGADYVATGHYAISKEGQLFAGHDKSKDQSYFLWTLRKEQIEKIIFPVGHLQKSEVRKLAEKYKLPTAKKKDSQGVCFLGPIDMKEFLSHYIEKKPGDVLDINGEIIGKHDGALFFTLGERHGFMITKKGIDDKPVYVVDRDLEKNSITVSENKNHEQKYKNTKEIKIDNINWISNLPPEKGKKLRARIRYQQPLQDCVVQNEIIIFDQPQIGVSSGQSLVVYDNDIVIGGGIIV
jgi:tRNA-specific 2-thiouridylase